MRSLPWQFDWFTLKKNKHTAGRGMDNRRHIIVINKKFQYQYSLLIAALAVILVNGFIIVRVLFPGEQPFYLSTSMAIGLALVEFLLITAIWYGCLIASHRIAGPVYVFTREITKLGDGDFSARMALRDKDMFQPEAEQMNKSLAALRSRIERVKSMSSQLQTTHASGGDIGPLVQKLTSELELFTNSNNVS
jgi:methyl-accepting chemotaxis protein